MAVFPAHPGHPNPPASAGGWLDGGTWIVVQAAKRVEFTVSCLLDADGFQLTQHGAVWEQHKRPRGTALTEWQGRKNFAASVAIVAEGWE